MVALSPWCAEASCVRLVGVEPVVALSPWCAEASCARLVGVEPVAR
ncbi:hypothetical protein [Nocardia beijingensis]